MQGKAIDNTINIENSFQSQMISKVSFSNLADQKENVNKNTSKKQKLDQIVKSNNQKYLIEQEEQRKQEIMKEQQKIQRKQLQEQYSQKIKQKNQKIKRRSKSKSIKSKYNILEKSKSFADLVIEGDIKVDSISQDKRGDLLDQMKNLYQQTKHEIKKIEQQDKRIINADINKVQNICKQNNQKFVQKKQQQAITKVQEEQLKKQKLQELQEKAKSQVQRSTKNNLKETINKSFHSQSNKKIQTQKSIHNSEPYHDPVRMVDQLRQQQLPEQQMMHKSILKQKSQIEQLVLQQQQVAQENVVPVSVQVPQRVPCRNYSTKKVQLQQQEQEEIKDIEEQEVTKIQYMIEKQNFIVGDNQLPFKIEKYIDSEDDEFILKRASCQHKEKLVDFDIDEILNLNSDQLLSKETLNI